MDCLNLADTGSNLLLLVALGVGLVSMAAIIYVWLGVKHKKSFQLISILGIMVFSLALFGASLTKPVHAQQNCDQASNVSKGSSAGSGNQGGSSGGSNPSTPPAAQKLWQIGFDSATDWNQFTYYNFSVDGTETYNLTAASGTGTATGVRPDLSTGSNSREIYVFNGATNVKDAEARALITVNPAWVGKVTQAGLALRASNLGDPVHQAAIVTWNNIMFNVTGMSLVGIWQENDQAGGSFNHNDLGGFYMSSKINSIVADGTKATVTVSGDLDPQASPGVTILINNSGSPLDAGSYSITSVIDSHTFTFATSQTGSWTSGDVNYALNAQRWFAARVVGDQVTIKHWLPNQTEPAWNDPYYTVTYSLPTTTLANGDLAPTAGQFGLIVAHVGNGNAVKFSNVSFKSLDP